jgi:hypothetical protein
MMRIALAAAVLAWPSAAAAPLTVR